MDSLFNYTYLYYCDSIFIIFQSEYSIVVYIIVFYCMLLLFVDNVIYFFYSGDKLSFK